MFTLSFFSPQSAFRFLQLYRGTTDSAIGPAIMLTCLNLGGIVGPNIYGLTGGGDPYAWAGHVVMACIFFTCAMIALGLKVATVEVVETDAGGEAFGRLVIRPSIMRLFGCKSTSTPQRTPLTDIGDASDSGVVLVPSTPDSESPSDCLRRVT